MQAQEVKAGSFLHIGHSTRHMRAIIRPLVALITGLVGGADMLSAIVPKLNWNILLGAWPIIHHRTQAQALTVVVGFFLIMLSYGLVRGKRHAWCITLILVLLSALLHIWRSGSVLATIVALALAALLATLVNFFNAKSDPPSAWRGYTALALGLGVVIFYTIGGFLILSQDFQALFDRFGIDGVLIRILSKARLLTIAHATPAFFFAQALPVLCISAVLYGMFQIFRPVVHTLLPNMEERNKVAEIIRLYGRNSISYFALDGGKSYFFSQSGKSVISYVLEGSTAVVAGDPIGPPAEIPLVTRQFIEFCNEQDWAIVFWQVRAELAGLYRAANMHLLKVGEDAVIDVPNFTLKGGAMANVRSSAKRAEKDGVQIVFYCGRVTDTQQLGQMKQISNHWLVCKGGREMGFSMGRFDPQGDKEQLCAVAVDGMNKVHAFATFVPIYARHGWGLDLMRRAEQAAPGTMELLLARSIEYMKSTGTEMVSLGLAPLGNANEEDDTFLGTSIDFLTERFGNPSKNLSLFNFKKKFQPVWESRYLVYSDTLSLPKIGWALYHAHQQDASILDVARRTLLDWLSSRRCRQEKIVESMEALKA